MGEIKGIVTLKKQQCKHFQTKQALPMLLELGRSKIDAETMQKTKDKIRTKPKFAGKKRKKSEEETNSCGIESKNNSDGFRGPEGIEGGFHVVQASGTSEERNTRKPVQEKCQVASIDDSDDDFVRPPKDKS
ncbi:hypothetical protein FRX31_013471 [Thalictrum thalictroides]|uniref:Uncharacterized protein n=1 Tax=Thalictrum thalictroides TaxID=46969 RepID=A0A7J6WLF8_THATH|nr:hypothetical protein FRX31_013471 [Thalictrum thalictroides]